MPHNNGRDFAMRILAPLLVASIIGGWGYTATRASEDDLERVESDVARVEEEMQEEGRSIRREVAAIRQSVHGIEVEQAAFRAQVREALKINND